MALSLLHDTSPPCSLATLRATATTLAALAAGIARLPADDVAAREVDNLCLVARAIVAVAVRCWAFV